VWQLNKDISFRLGSIEQMTTRDYPQAGIVHQRQMPFYEAVRGMIEQCQLFFFAGVLVCAT